MKFIKYVFKGILGGLKVWSGGGMTISHKQFYISYLFVLFLLGVYFFFTGYFINKTQLSGNMIFIISFVALVLFTIALFGVIIVYEWIYNYFK